MLFLTSKDEADEYWFDSKVLHIEMKARKCEISCYSQWDTRKKNSRKFLLGLNISLKILIFPVNSGETHL